MQPINMSMQSQLKDLLNFCRQNSRVCPHPLEWETLWNIILDRKRNGMHWKPHRPLILSDWWKTSIQEKQIRLKEHLRWAYEHEIFDKVEEFIRKLSEEQWYHAQND